MLKGVIFSLRNVLAKNGDTDSSVLRNTLKLLKYLKSKGVEPVFFGNHDWSIKLGSKKDAIPFKDFLEKNIGPVHYYIGGKNGVPMKPTAASTAFILNEHGWNASEIMYVGNTPDDMKTAKNGNILFINALWHGEETDYGFKFSDPGDVARFIDCICLGLNDWFWKIEQPPLRAYAMAPFTTMSSHYMEAHAYSSDARATAKSGAGHAEFWGRLIAARVYFSGLAQEIDYITAYPGHAPGSKQTVIAEALNILGQSVAKSYIPDLIERHTAAVQSHKARAGNRPVGLENQLTTIKLSRNPSRGIRGKRYTNQPLKRGKTILLVDDFCTEGNSFEAGRAFLEALGAKVICLSWLKTINTDYQKLAAPVSGLKPYEPLQVSRAISRQPISFSSGVVNHSASDDLADLYERYMSWDWSGTTV